MVALRTIPVLTYLRRAGPYLALPVVVLLGSLAVLAPDVWGAVYASAEFCRAYLAETSAFDVLPVLAIVLVSGPMVMAIFTAVRELLRLSMLSKSLARPGSSAVRSSPGYSVVQLEDPRPFAFCHGLLRPRIYFSSGLVRLLTQGELQAVLLHEEVHARRRDPLRVFVARVAAAGLFAIPVTRLVRDRYLARLETAADREVVARRGVAPLAAALAKLLAIGPSAPRAAAVSRFNPSKQRIDQLVGSPASAEAPLVPARQLWASAATVVASAGLAAGAVYGVNGLLLATSYCRVPMV